MMKMMWASLSEEDHSLRASSGSFRRSSVEAAAARSGGSRAAAARPPTRVPILAARCLFETVHIHLRRLNSSVASPKVNLRSAHRHRCRYRYQKIRCLAGERQCVFGMAPPLVNLHFSQGTTACRMMRSGRLRRTQPILVQCAGSRRFASTSPGLGVGVGVARCMRVLGTDVCRM